MKSKIIFVMMAVFFFCQLPLALAAKELITLNQYVSHPALDAAALGVEQALKERKILPEKADLKIDNAQGNISHAVQIAKWQAAQNPACMIAIATPCAQSCLKARNKTIPLAFVAVTSPNAAGLRQSNVLGVSDSPPVEELVIHVHKKLPNVKTIGVLYNPGEINAVQTVERLEKIANTQNFSLKKVAITASHQVKAGVLQLTKEVDVIYIPQDNLIVSAIEVVIREAKKAHLPVIANDPCLVEKGVLFAFGSDYFKSGWQLGQMIADSLEGKKLPVPIQAAKHRELKVNETAAKELGLSLTTLLKEET